MKLSEALIASNESLKDFQSVTGFQVVALPDGYVTFEGNGRDVHLAVFCGDTLVAAIPIWRVSAWKNAMGAINR